MCQRVERRDSCSHIHEQVKEKRNGDGDRREDAHPSVPEDQGDKWGKICQQHKRDRKRSERHAVTQASEEILGYAANQIAKARLPAKRKKADSYSHATSIAA